MVDDKYPARLELTIRAESTHDILRQLKTLAQEWAAKPPENHFKGNGRKCEYVGTLTGSSIAT